mmetsp:Transcript_29340/g.73849  ORF Transcript_29340/g.73849 Transcript_29340/m.73849 type:complete len:366 (-) Transcript_29340:27-1124(-)
MREDHRRNHVIVQMEILLVQEESGSQPTAGRDRNRSQFDLAVHITDSKNVFHIGRLKLVSGDLTASVHLNSSIFQTKVLGERCTADGEDHLFDVLQSSVFRVVGLEHKVSVVLFLDGSDTALLHDVHTGLFHLFHDGLVDDRVEGAQKVVMADQKTHLGPEGVQDASQLHRNVASTTDGHRLGKILDLEKVITVQCVLLAGNVGHAGLATDRDQHVLASHLLVVHLNRVCVHKLGPAIDVLDFGIGQETLVDTGQTIDVSITLRLDHLPIELDFADAKSVVGSIVKALCNVRRIEHDLLGNTATHHTGAAKQVAFDQRHLGAILSRTTSSCHSTAAASYHNQIVIVLRHRNRTRSTNDNNLSTIS